MAAKKTKAQPQRWTEYVSLDEVESAKRNPKGHAESDIDASIGRFGYVAPMVQDERTGRLVIGHGRLESLKRQRDGGADAPDGIEVKDGVWHVPVSRGWSSRSDAEADALLLADNRLTEKGGWDDSVLHEMLGEIVKLDFENPLEGIGWDEDEVGEMLGLGGTDGETDPDDVPKPPEETECYVKPGDLWQLGEHRIICGDCTDEVTVKSVLSGKRWNLMVTDPPYGVSYAGKNAALNALDGGARNERPIEHDHAKPEDMSRLWVAAFKAAVAHGAKGACYYSTGPQGGDLLLLLLQAMRQAGLPLRHMLVWAKNNHVLGRSDYNYKHEPIIYGWLDGGHKFHGPTNETSLWEIPKPQKSAEHPTMKPVELFARAVRNSSTKKSVVYEPFSGSGTAVIACEQEGRACRGIEIEPRYVQVAIDRWQNFTGKKAERVEATTKPKRGKAGA